MNNPILHKERFLVSKFKSALWLLCGLCSGALLSYLALATQISNITSDNNALGQLINQQSLEISQLRTQLGAQFSSQSIPIQPSLTEFPLTAAPKTAASDLTKPAVVTVKPAPQAAVVPPKNKDIPKSAAVAVTTPIAPPPVASAPTPVASVAAAHVAPLQSAVKVVQATFSQANITGMDGNGITFKTGLNVPIGGTFPSGERLLSVLPAEKKIVTDKRIILLRADEDSIAR